MGWVPEREPTLWACYPTELFCLSPASGCGVCWRMDSAQAPSPTETISAQLRMILRGVLAVLGIWRLGFGQMRLVHRRISTTLQRIERLLARFRAGRLPQIRQRAIGQRRGGCVVGRGPTLPRRFGWLVQIGGHQAACAGSQLQTVLNTPEMAELLAASAQAGRILRPLCRAFAVELPGIGSASRKVAAEGGERARRRTRPHAQPEPFQIPLPRGVLRAARREGFGKDR